VWFHNIQLGEKNLICCSTGPTDPVFARNEKIIISISLYLKVGEIYPHRKSWIHSLKRTFWDRVFEQDEYLDHREQVDKNEGKIYFFRSLPTRNWKKIFLFYRPTDPYFSYDLPVKQQIKFVSPYSLLFYMGHPVEWVVSLQFVKTFWLNTVGKITKKQSEVRFCKFGTVPYCQKYTLTDCFLGNFARW